jgi:hypothetical protein
MLRLTLLMWLLLLRLLLLGVKWLTPVWHHFQ